jgi:hypothetical protein
VTRWGLVLLIAFLVIGLRPAIETSRAARLAVWWAAGILVYVFVKGHAL